MCVPQLTNFFQAIKEDNRIATSHISLYMALFQLWNESDFNSPVSFTRQELMELAKINGIATYHKCIKDLNNFGYIKYTPSYQPGRKSIAFFNLA